MTKIDARKTANMLMDLLAGRADTSDEEVQDALQAGAQIVWKYKAIEDIVLRPEGMDEPGGIKVEDILNPNAEVCETRGGWELRTWETRCVAADDKK